VSEGWRIENVNEHVVVQDLDTDVTFGELVLHFLIFKEIRVIAQRVPQCAKFKGNTVKIARYSDCHSEDLTHHTVLHKRARRLKRSYFLPFAILYTG
jgi:hypothetical protein